MTLELDDLALCRRILARGRVAEPRPSAAQRLGLRLALPWHGRARRHQVAALHALLNDPDVVQRTAQAIERSAPRWLPEVGVPGDLYYTLFFALADALSMAPDYWNFTRVGLGRQMRARGLEGWVHGFGYHVLSSRLAPAEAEAFIDAGVGLGRAAVLDNLDPSRPLGPVARLFFAERGLPVPESAQAFLHLERARAAAVRSALFEIAVRAVKGTNSLAFALAYAVWGLGDSDAPDRSDEALLGVVMDALRVCPPIARVGRLTQRPTVGAGVDVPGGSHVVFDVQAYNRRLPPAEVPDVSRGPQLRALRAEGHRIATFGSYGYQRCPAAAFSYHALLAALRALTAARAFVPDPGAPNYLRTRARNPRPEVTGRFVSRDASAPPARGRVAGSTPAARSTRGSAAGCPRRSRSAR